MSIYISCHPIDDLFAIQILVYMRQMGVVVRRLPISNDASTGDIDSGDIVIMVLRSEYINSDFYSELACKLTNCTVLPILRSPIAISDWADKEVLNPIVDFSNYKEEQIASGLQQLAVMLTSLNSADINTHVLIDELLSSNLEAETLHHWRPVYLLEHLNFGRILPSRLPIYHLLSNGSFEVRSGVHASSSAYRVDRLSNIATSRESCLVNCGDIDTNLVALFMVYIDQQSIISSDSYTIPLLLDVRIWDKDLSSAQWLSEKTGIKKAALGSIQKNHFTIYIYGLDHSNIDPSQVNKDIVQWWNQISPTLSLVMICPSSVFTLGVDVEEFPVIQSNWELLQQVCALYHERAFAQYIMSSAIEVDSNRKFLAQNPILTTTLLSIDFGDEVSFSELSPKDYFECLIKNLWGCASRNTDEYLSVEDGFAKIAAIMTENRKDFISYEDALIYIPSESLLHKCIDSGLFSLVCGKLRFSLLILQNYYTALALMRYGIPSHLPSLTLGSNSARIPQKWDKSLILASYFVKSDNLDKLISRIADSDPLVALECLVVSRQRNSPLYSLVIEKNLESLVSIGDFRTDFAKYLYDFDASMAQAILVESVQSGNWEVRRYAYQTLNRLNFPLKVGLIESLADLNDDSRPNVALALKRISADALPTLFRLLQSDNDTTRYNAIWALGETVNKAVVPALVNLLDDSNVSVAVLAAGVIARTHDVYALPYLLRHLRHRHIHVRTAVEDAIMTLFDQQPDAFIKILKRLDVSTRSQMVIYLSTSKFSKLNINLLLQLTQDEDVDVRIAAIQALAPVKEPQVIARFKECLDDMSKSRLNKSSVGEIVSRILSNVSHGDSGSNFHAKSSAMNSSQIVKARLLSAKSHHPNPDDGQGIGDKGASSESDTNLEDGYVTDILTQLRSRKWDTSNNAAKMLRDYMKSLRGNASSKVINQVLETLNDDDWVIRWTGVESLGWVGNVYVVPHLIQRLSDTNWKIRVAAIRALTEIKDNSAIVGLSKLNTDTNTVVREAAAEALGFLDSKQAVVPLGVFASDSEDFVRLASVESLGRLCDKITTSFLLSALKDTSEHVRWAAANGLLGIADEKILPQLIPSLSDVGGPYWEQKRICDVIIDILKKINTEGAKKAIAEWQTSQV